MNIDSIDTFKNGKNSNNKNTKTNSMTNAKRYNTKDSFWWNNIDCPSIQSTLSCKYYFQFKFNLILIQMFIFQ